MQVMRIACIQQLSNPNTKGTGWEQAKVERILETQESGFETDTPFRRRV
jgi:hypothetical protein